jgi:hypothetical protein
MEIMQKIPQYVSDYISEAIQKERLIFSADLSPFFVRIDKRFTEIDKRFIDIDKRFTEIDLGIKEINHRIIESHDSLLNEFEFQKGAIINEFDSRLRTIGEYIDTKTTPDEVRQIIHEEKGL